MISIRQPTPALAPDNHLSINLDHRHITIRGMHGDMQSRADSQIAISGQEKALEAEVRGLGLLLDRLG